MKPRYATSPWTEEVNDAAKQQWERGISASIIGRLNNISRNAVIGRAHRKKWVTPKTKFSIPGLRKPRKPRPIGADGSLMVKLQTAHKPPKFPKDNRKPSKTKPIASRNMNILELGPHDCRYPTSPDDATSHLFCGAEAIDGPYCLHHAQICYRPTARQMATPDLPHGKSRAEHAGSSA